MNQQIVSTESTYGVWARKLPKKMNGILTSEVVHPVHWIAGLTHHNPIMDTRTGFRAWQPASKQAAILFSMVLDSDASEQKLPGEKTSQQSSIAATTESGVDTQPRCSQEHVLNCQFNQWYSLFKHCTPRSVVLELSEDVVDYLQGDGVLLPKGFEMSCGKGASVEDDDEVDWNGSDDEDEDQKVRHCLFWHV